jgi:hypothetical protein
MSIKEKKDIKSFKRFENLYWAFKNYEKNPLKYKHPKENCLKTTWNRWFEDEKLRFHVICTIDYNCFWRKVNCVMLFCNCIIILSLSIIIREILF